MRNLEVFRSGFFYIAQALGIKYLVLGAFSPSLSLEGKNELRIIHVEDMENVTCSVDEFVDTQRNRILTEVGSKWIQ